MSQNTLQSRFISLKKRPDQMYYSGSVSSATVNSDQAEITNAISKKYRSNK